MLNNPNKNRDIENLRTILPTWDEQKQTNALLRFIAKQLIDIKYDIREIKNIQHGI